MSAHTPATAAEVLNELESISSDMDDHPSWLDTVNRSMLVINGLVSTHDQLLAERDALRATTAKLREALTELLDARGTSLNIVGHDPVSGHPLSREGMAALKARAALSSTTP